MPDIGLTHLALAVSDLDRSLAFYEDWTDMRPVHRRGDVAWISDGTRPFALVLAEDDQVNALGPFSHLGFAVESKERVVELAERAREAGILRSGPNESGPPVGTWCFIADPDGHIVEFSHGQEVERSVDALAGKPLGRLSSVSVIGSGSESHAELAIPVGRMLAELNVDLVCGGGAGVMEAVAKGFVAVRPRAGRAIGILPAGPPPGYPNQFIEVVIETHLSARGEAGCSMESRNHLVVLSGNAVVALPGSAGTASERRLAERYGRSLIEVESPDALEGLKARIGRALAD